MSGTGAGRRFPRCVLFDLDGTLLDSAPDMSATIDRMRAARGGNACRAGADDQNLRLMRDFKALAGNRVRVNRHR